MTRKDYIPQFGHISREELKKKKKRLIWLGKGLLQQLQYEGIVVYDATRALTLIPTILQDVE